MITDIYNNICNKQNIKENLQKLKDELKQDKKEGTHNRAALLYHIGNDVSVITELLLSDEPKLRKNAANVLELLEIQDTLAPLYEAYSTEETMFVRSSYLAAIGKLDYHSIFEALVKRRDNLISSDITEESAKHITEEIRELIRLTDNYQKNKRHAFTGYNIENELVLLTNRNFKSVTTASLQGIPHKEFTAGVMVKTNRLPDVMKVRTFSELLFIPDGIKACSRNPMEAAGEIISGGIYDYIRKRHEDNSSPFYFRVEVKCSNKEDEGAVSKKLGILLEQKSGWKLVNSVSDYELELRLVETKNNSFNILIKFCTLPDNRFSYRKETISAGMKPYLAALCMELARPYIREGSAVLDPFCGTGTMLIERRKLMKTYVMYGIDIYGEAIEKAKKNISLAGMDKNTYLINRDFFQFSHEHCFDEIITDMPFETNRKDVNDIEKLYRQFFMHIGIHINEKSTIIMYSHNRFFAQKYAALNGYKAEKEFEISRVEGSYLLIFRPDESHRVNARN